MKPNHCGDEEARARLPELLERAHHGGRTVITKHGEPYAALVPVEEASTRRKISLLTLRGSGAGLWDKDPARFVARIRDEWE
jgi:prevent-host-death family protein